MAEEKDKKTKTAKKEVAVEKKFCTKCGRELNAGEECTCSSTNNATDPMLSFFNGFLDTVKGIIKKPYETLKNEVKKSNVTHAVIMIIMGAISFGLFLMAAIKSLYVSVLSIATHIGEAAQGASEFTKWGDMMESILDADGSFPYFSQFLFGILAFVAIAAIIIVITVLFAKYKKSKFDFKEGLTLFAVSSLPLMLAFLVMAVLGLFNNYVIMLIALLFGLVVAIFCAVNYVNVFMTYINGNESERMMNVAVLVILIVLGVGLFTTLTWKPIGSEIGEQIIDLNS